ncbi:MAG: hypothetical protein Ct9H300mP21_04010 [Pseudomonadota bacterium]|nr:MAG: hypothetical protein Ct9H300mP21_04010 [Pseudomonadota bacterium]
MLHRMPLIKNPCVYFYTFHWKRWMFFWANVLCVQHTSALITQSSGHELADEKTVFSSSGNRLKSANLLSTLLAETFTLLFIW